MKRQRDDGRLCSMKSENLKSTNIVSKILFSIVDSKYSSRASQLKGIPRNQILQERVLNSIDSTNAICKKDSSIPSPKNLETKKSRQLKKKIPSPSSSPLISKSKLDSEQNKRAKVESFDTKRIPPSISKLGTARSSLIKNPFLTTSSSKELQVSSTAPPKGDSKLDSKSQSTFYQIRNTASFSQISASPSARLGFEFGQRFRQEIQNIQIENKIVHPECIRGDPWANLELFQILNNLEGRKEKDIKVKVHEILL